MKNLVLILLTSVTFSNAFADAPSMHGWECNAYLDTYTAYSAEDFSYEQASDDDWAWLSENEAIEDAFDEIRSDSVYNECAFSSVRAAFKALEKSVPSVYFWTTDIEYFTKKTTFTTETLMVGDATVLVPSEPIKTEELAFARSLFEELMKTHSCEVTGDCRKIRFCAYSCKKY